MLSFELDDVAALPKVLRQLLKHQQAEINALLAQQPKPRYIQLIPFLEQLDNQLHLFWSPISHLHSVKNSDVLRDSYEHCLPLLSEHGTWLSHHQGLFYAFEHIASSLEFNTLKPAQKKHVQDRLRDFKLAGVHLKPEDKAHVAEIMLQLSALSNKYEQNLMDASEDWQLFFDDEKALQGLPENARALLAQNAKEAGKEGYLLNLQAPCYQAVITYADDRALRQTIHEAWITRASDLGPSAGKFDNTKIMYDLLNLKDQLAKLLGFPNYAAYSLETKMAENPKEVADFLSQLVKLAKPFAERELVTLTALGKHLGLAELEAWDIAYVSEKLKQQQLQIDNELLRPFFPLPVVLQGLFTITGTLFNLSFKPAPELAFWHEDVQAYAIQNEHQETIAITQQNKTQGDHP